MTNARADATLDRRVSDALRLARSQAPQLAELAASVRIEFDPRVETAGVFASGRLLLNRDFVGSLTLPELAFVLAHEIMHLELATHRRTGSSDPKLVNLAHDLIINDMLLTEWRCSTPAGGPWFSDARLKSLEGMVAEVRKWWSRPCGSWGAAASSWILADSDEIDEVATQQSEAEEWDVLFAKSELEMFPELTEEQQQRDENAIAKRSSRAVELESIVRSSRVDAFTTRVHGEDDVSEQMVGMEQIAFRAPWELVLQKWVDNLAPRTRTYARPSRRGTVTPDIARPGRRREGWMLNVVLDTSGSMSESLSRCLGLIASFADASGVETIRVLQCDDALCSDTMVSPEELARFPIRGFGGSNMSPALLELARDAETTGAIVLTDGCIGFPRNSMPYAVLWVLTEDDFGFEPGYGRVVTVPGLASGATVPLPPLEDMELYELDEEV